MEENGSFFCCTVSPPWGCSSEGAREGGSVIHGWVTRDGGEAVSRGARMGGRVGAFVPPTPVSIGSCSDVLPSHGADVASPLREGKDEKKRLVIPNLGAGASVSPPIFPRAGHRCLEGLLPGHVFVSRPLGC